MDDILYDKDFQERIAKLFNFTEWQSINVAKSYDGSTIWGFEIHINPHNVQLIKYEDILPYIRDWKINQII
jgi:hypothetical protein